jgi:arsenate reductase-like glutaredoxin family protein
MQIKFDISITEFSAEDQALIKDSLGISSNAEMEIALGKISKTAFSEYCKMFKEKGIPTRADEVMQERLFFLLKYYYIDHLPNENEISTIFHLTPSQSRTLLRNTKSRYRTKIKNFISKSLEDIIRSITKNDETGRYEFICYSGSVVEELNLILSQKGPELEQIVKTKGTGSKYECDKDTFKKLKEIFNIKP